MTARNSMGLAAAGAALLLSACGGGGTAASPEAPTAVTLSAQARLGEKIFNDVSLSASGRQACASCHADATGSAGPNSLAAQLGGALLDRAGDRSAPSIRYLAANTAFHFAADGTPTGGFFWDGRAASLQAQAREPFLQPSEMANGSVADVIEKLSRASYSGEFRAAFGDDILARPDEAFARIALALQQFQLEDRRLHAFNSRYDEFLRGHTPLTDQEMRGLALFNNPLKGNCAACHPSARGSDGSLPLFTDFSFDNLGVPRNPALARNADPAHFDLGLCARAGGDMAARTDLCGAFKVPSLRNVALRKVLFHNGRFRTLKEALTFYVQRDTHPEKWYPRNADGTLHKFDDLPPAYTVNVNTVEVPYNRHVGDAPALSDAEIDDVIVFLGTLNDGYEP